jgi:uncharacterized protein YecE (DUF72 family)
MSRRDAAIRIGTSGWHYPHWRGPFYPEKLPASKMLEFYTRHFETVELNHTFYRLPQPRALESWRDTAPPGFLFAAKGSRYLTHMKKLSDAAPGIKKFFEGISVLGKKLGPIVFQLPPWWEVNAKRLERFLEELPPRRHYAFELRNPTWHSDQIYEILRRHRAAFCIFEIAGFRSSIELTANFAYVRLHGPDGAYQGKYSRQSLRQWADRIREWRQDLTAIYIYFDNDQAGYAVKNAIALRRMLA